MKHSLKITALLLSMFFITQLIGLAVLTSYAPEVKTLIAENGSISNITTHNLPAGFEPPQETPQQNLTSLVIAFIIAILLMVLLMNLRAEVFLRLWFFAVVVIALGVTFFAALRYVDLPFWVPLACALPLAYLKVFKRNIVLHNVTELFIYPGIAALFVPLLSLWTVALLLIIISVYDMVAVWRTGFMQRMAKYQIKTLRIFSGFFVPYLGQKARALVTSSKKKDLKKVRVSVAILGGGDVVFPIIVAGVVMREFSLFPALLVSLCATLALALLFYFSEKGKFYPAMPFISIGCFVGMGLAYLV